ncbi:MAG TPA: hypothetical protein VE984_03510 [Gaiellaceae bacterium]|nr:hypothetical protein [Gaiellaceae bacterium]
MRRLSWIGLLLAAALVLFSAPAGAAKSQATREKRTAKPVVSLAMDGSRVAYMTTDRNVAVWNVRTGKLATVKGTYPNKGAGFGFGSGEVAIAGKRVTLITRFVTGNSQQTQEHLYTATAGGTAHQLAKTTNHQTNPQDGQPDGGLSDGSWIAGVVGSGKVLAVSSWKSSASVPSGERLSLVTPTGLHTIATGAGAVVARSADSGHIAVFRSTEAWPADDVSPATAAPTVGVYSSGGTLLDEVGVDRHAVGVALSGDELVVLTETIPQPGSLTVTLRVYDWKTGALVHTWPVEVGHVPPATTFAVHGELATVEGASNLHLVDLKTGKDDAIAPCRNGCSAALGARGLVYAANPSSDRKPGKLVFVPTAKLLAAVA